MKNPNCDNDKCMSDRGQVRLLPVGAGGNAILCLNCYKHEIRFRKERNLTLSKDNQFDLPEWSKLEVYQP